MPQEPSSVALKQKIKELEEQLADSRETAARLSRQAGFLKAIIDNTNLPIYLKNRDFSYLLVNRQYEMLARIEPDSICGKNDFDIFPEPVAALFRSQDNEVIAKEALVEFTETIPLPDGIHTFITAKFPLIDDNGEIYAVGGVCTDVTALQVAREELLHSETKLRNIIDSCPLGIFQYALEENNRLILRGANPAASKILGVDCLALLGKAIEEAFPPLAATEIPAKFRKACRDGVPWQTDLLGYKYQQVEGDYKVNAFQTEPGMAAVIFEDVTQQRLIDQELQKLHKLESIGILAGGIAHDFNNLLTVITGNISLAKTLVGDDGDITGKLANAEKASARAQDLTKRLLTFSTGGAPVRKAAYLGELITDSTTFTLSGSNVNSRILMADDLRPVRVDTDQLSQVIQNLVMNGDQAMPAGGTITVRAANFDITRDDTLPLPAGSYVRITVEDQGAGIHENLLPKIFDPFFSTKSAGSGLGLAVAHSIVKNHDGLLTAESDGVSGSKFHIYLPATAAPDQAARQHQESALSDGCGRILIMDDEDTVLNVAADLLTHIGYESTKARNGTEAVALYRQAMTTGPPFVGVMLDLTVPGGMGGKETMKRLLEIDPEVKALIASGYANDPIMADHTKYGFKGVVAKPYDLDKLRKTLDDLFR